MRSTLTEFARQTLDWEREVDSLFDEVQSLATDLALQATVKRPEDTFVTEQLGDVATYQQELSKKQEVASAELAVLRQLVEQQSDLLVEFMSNAQTSAQAAKQESHDTAFDAVQDREDSFVKEQLGEVANCQQELSKKQEVASAELSVQRQLVEQQSDLLVAFIGNTQNSAPAAKSMPPRGSQEAVVSEVQAQFEKLQKKQARS